MIRAMSYAVAVVIGLSQPALAECFGRYPNLICISDSGDVWTPQGYFSGRSSASSGGSGIARYPNATAAEPPPASAPRSRATGNSGAAGATAVLQPSAQGGNAWVLKPQGGDGATVLGGPAGASAP